MQVVSYFALQRGKLPGAYAGKKASDKFSTKSGQRGRTCGGSANYIDKVVCSQVENDKDRQANLQIQEAD